MDNLLIFICLICLPSLVNAQFHEPVLPDQEGQDLLDDLVQFYKPVNVLGYGPARDTLYGTIYFNDDSVRCVYTGHAVFLPPGVDPSVALFMNGANDGINAEHTYPRSKGADESNGNPYSDMHHIYPSKTPVNAARADFPFLEILDNETDVWYYLNQTSSSIPGANIDLYSEKIDGAFEPREDHKGNVARAMFYFYTMYKQEADEADPVFFDIQKETLCQWHDLDPVDSLEWARTYQIAQHQDGLPNPFILDCSLPYRTYCNELSPDCAELINTKVEEPGAFVSEFKIFPNPATEHTTIRFVLETSVRIEVKIFDILGREINSFPKEEYTAGEHDIVLSRQSKGLYVCLLTVSTEDQDHFIARRILFD